MMLDLRHLDADVLAAMLRDNLDACEERRGGRSTARSSSRRVFGADADAVPPAAGRARPGGGRRTPAATTATPIPSGPLHDATEIGRLVPTVMIFAQSDPPLSHTAIEDSPEAALRVAIEAYGRTVGAALDAVAAGEVERLAA